MSMCPCGLEKKYSECCEPIIKGKKKAETAEQLMRSRYSAYVKVDVDHLYNSIHPDNREDHSEKSTRDWAEKSEWLSLEILNTSGGGPDDDTGHVEFCAYYRQKVERVRHQELASFKKVDDTWYFEDGKPVNQEQFKRNQPKVGRNEPCPCGSGKKFKKCCG